jgi:hypothetical protein
MTNASIMESMDCSDQNTEPKMLGSTKKAYEDFSLSMGFHTGLICIGVYRLIIRKLIYLLKNGQNKSDRDFSAPNDPYGSFSSKRWLVWDP